MEHPSIIFKIVCPDRPGLVSKLQADRNYGGNIKHSDHHTDQTGLFLSRIEWNTNFSVLKKEIYDDFKNCDYLEGKY